MSKLDRAKEVIKENFKDARCGIFNTRCLVPDPMVDLCEEPGLNIDICYTWEYFEVFGLTDDEFKQLAKYYYELCDELMEEEIDD